MFFGSRNDPWLTRLSRKRARSTNGPWEKTRWSPSQVREACRKKMRSFAVAVPSNVDRAEALSTRCTRPSFAKSARTRKPLRVLWMNLSVCPALESVANRIIPKSTRTDFRLKALVSRIMTSSLAASSTRQMIRVAKYAETDQSLSFAKTRKRLLSIKLLS